MSATTAVYIRSARGSESAAEQREETFEYADDELGIDSANIRVFSDIGTHKRADQSSAHQQLFDLEENGDIERVIIRDAARLARDMRGLHDLIAQFVEDTVEVHIIASEFQVGKTELDGEPDDRTLLHALAIAAELETTVRSERTKEGVAVAKARGNHIGRPPYGFDSDGAGGLIPNENFETALEVIDRIEANQSKRGTARQTNVNRHMIKNIIGKKDLYYDYAADMAR
jgi:DNA invertase Pin-like site-specific DNA recombinase